MTDAPHPRLRSFGRIRSRTLKSRQAVLLDRLAPQLALDLSGPLDPAALTPGARAVWLEIGFGGGEHLAEQAARHPEVLVLGAEPFVNGAASALRHIDERDLSNVRLHQGDARDLLAVLPDASVERLFILFPDPWQKARHHKRRLIQPEAVDSFVRVLKPGGRLRFATDWADYAEWALERFNAEPRLRRLGDGTEAPDDHVPTRYQLKRLGDIEPVFFEFERV